jgi:hypothetical protein
MMPTAPEGRAQRPLGIAALGQPGAPLEDVPGGEVPGQQPGQASGEEVERQHDHAAAPGELSGVARFVREQKFCAVHAFGVQAGHDHVAEAERRCRWHRQPVAEGNQQAFPRASQPGPASCRH